MILKSVSHDFKISEPWFHNQWAMTQKSVSHDLKISEPWFWNQLQWAMTADCAFTISEPWLQNQRAMILKSMTVSSSHDWFQNQWAMKSVSNDFHLTGKLEPGQRLRTVLDSCCELWLCPFTVTMDRDERWTNKIASGKIMDSTVKSRPAGLSVTAQGQAVLLAKFCSTCR